MKIEMVQELTGRYMRITKDEREEDFGQNMLNYNQIEGILPAKIHQVDNQFQYLYDVGNHISLLDLFQKTILTSRELISILVQLVHLLEQAGEYFLNEKNLILSCEFIFYDEKTHRISLAYLDGYNQEVGKGISHILEKFMDYMNHHDRELVFLVYGLHKICKGKNFQLSQMTEFFQESPEIEPPFREEWRERKGGERKSAVISGERPVAVTAEPDYPAPDSRKGIFWKQKAVLYAAGILIIFIVMKSGILNNIISETGSVQKGILAVVFFLIGAYIWKKYSFNLKDEEKMEELNPDEADATVVLDLMDDRGFCINLIPEDWRREEIKIRKSPFFLGKDSAKADGVIADAEVSRVHVKIVMEEGQAFIIDQESTNGTYVGKHRLMPWERRNIQNGDRIGISSIYYKVEIHP